MCEGALPMRLTEKETRERLRTMGAAASVFRGRPVLSQGLMVAVNMARSIAIMFNSRSSSAVLRIESKQIDWRSKI